MGKIAFLFAGQGAQKPGMGLELTQSSTAAREILTMADAIRPGTADQLQSASQEDLNRTVNTQPCLFCADLMAAAALQEQGITPDACAGFSLGEIPALAFSGALTPADAFRFVIRRAQTMDACGTANEGAMFAVVKLTAEAVESLCAAIPDCWPVNYNSAAQTVVACAKASAEALTAAVRAAGGRAMPLAVSGAFHSPLMDEAAATLEQEFGSLPFHAPAIQVYANRTGVPYLSREQLFEQVNHPVLWQKTIEAMAADGVDTFIEVGPGKTLSSLVPRILPDARAYRVEDAVTLHSTLEALQNA